MQHLLKLPLGLFAACLLFAAGPAHAAKMPKVDICHFDADEGIYKKSAVSGNAMQPHLDHGDVIPGVDNEPPLPDLDDDCFAIIVHDPIARAYIDVDQDGAYDATKDVDIAVLRDTDDSGGLTVGDTIELGQYPKTFIPCTGLTVSTCDLGIFNNNTHTVTRVFPPPVGCPIAVDSDSLQLLLCRGSERETLKLNDQQFGTPTGGNDVFIRDFYDDPSSSDLLAVHRSPLWEASDVFGLVFAPAGTGVVDDHFINVIIY